MSTPGGGRKGRRASRRERQRDRQRVPPASVPPAGATQSTRWRFDAVAPFIGPIVVALAGISMVAWTWRTWPDVIVDFGREIYLAWRLAEGDTLYVDAHHFSGPLSPYLNALWFRLFGPGVVTLAMANLALATAFVALVYRLLARLADRFAATVACVFFITGFGCAQYTIIGNYNWICPYSHELTHGIMLAVAGIACIARYQDGRRLRWLVGAGLCAGLVVLTKVEVVVAGVPAIALGLALAGIGEAPAARRSAAIVAAFVGGMAVPLVATYLWFAPVMTPQEIFAWPLGHWRAAGRGDFTASPFYRRGLGIDDLSGNVGRLGVASFGWLAVVGAAVLAGRSRLRHPIAVAACFGVALWVGRLWSQRQWADDAMRPLPLVVGLVALGALAGFVRHRRDATGGAFALRVALAVFALGMLAKMILSVRIYHYGFALAAPAAIVVVATLLGWIPAAVARAGGSAPIVRAALLGVLAAATTAHVATTKALVDRKVRVVGTGRDAFYADDRGLQVAMLLKAIEARVGKDATLAAFPEGAFVNYLARRRNPTPFLLFDRTTLTLWGENAASEALAGYPPDWMVIVDRGLRDLHARGIFDWINGNYIPLWQFGFPDFTDERFSLMLMARGDPAFPDGDPAFPVP